MTETRTPAPLAAEPQPGGDIFNDPVFLRNLKIAVVVMALILILGFIAIIARIFYLSSRTPAQPPQAATSPSPTAAPLAMGQIAARARLELPRDAAIRSMALSGSRLAVQFEAPTGPGIAILDLESGKTLGRIEVGAESPR